MGRVGCRQQINLVDLGWYPSLFTTPTTTLHNTHNNHNNNTVLFSTVLYSAVLAAIGMQYSKPMLWVIAIMAGLTTLNNQIFPADEATIDVPEILLLCTLTKRERERRERREREGLMYDTF